MYRMQLAACMQMLVFKSRDRGGQARSSLTGTKALLLCACKCGVLCRSHGLA